MITDPFFFSIPDSHAKKSTQTPVQQFAQRCREDSLSSQLAHGQSAWAVFIAWVPPLTFVTRLLVHSKLFLTRYDQCTTAVVGATYSNTGARCTVLDQYPQTQIRFTGFPVLTRLSAAKFLCSTPSRSRIGTSQSSLTVPLLTSGDVSDPSTQGYDGGPAVSACASFTRASQTASWSTSTMTDEWHGCRILVQFYRCCVCGRYWSNVFDHRTRRRSRRVVSMRSATHWRACFSSDPLRTRTSRSKPQHHQ